MRTVSAALPLALLILAVPARATAAAPSRVSSAPHFLVLADRERIVLFIDGPVAGAMADHHADGSVAVTIPRVSLADGLADRDFDDASSGGDGKTHVRLVAGKQGDVLVRIASAAPIASVHAYAAKKPTRLTIDLMRTASKPDAPTTGGAKADAASSAAAAGKVKRTAKGAPQERSARAPGDAAGEGPSSAPPGGPATTVARPASSAAPGPGGTATPARTSAPPAPEASAPAASPETNQGAAGIDASAGTSAASAGAAATPADEQRSNATLVCRWRRSSGMPYCAPDPKAAIYALDLDTATLAGHLDRARGTPIASALPQRGAAETFLDADLELLTAARTGWMLPVVGSYERALRAYPGFADAPRARANMALLDHALGFAPELERMAREKDDPVAPFAGVLLADLRREDGERDGLAALLDAGTKAGGVTACLAARVRGNLAADAAETNAVPEALATLAQLCPRTLVEDPATAWLRGRAMILGGDAARGASTLAALETELPRRERGLLLAELAHADDALGDTAKARGLEERLASGAFGSRAVRAAQMSLAARDAAEGRTAAAAQRIAGMRPIDAQQSRDQADLVAVSELLREGNEVAALGLVSERKIDVRRLDLGEQVLIARSYRRIGLVDQAQRILQDVAARTPAKRLPDAYWEELGAEALARGDASGALAAVAQWQQAHTGTVPAGSVALQARARAALGDARGASELLSRELAQIDPEMARDVSVDVAHDVLSADPALALGLARGALDAKGLPPLADARQAAALRVIADAAETLGDRAAAASAFARLAREHAGDPAAAGAAYQAARLASAVPGAGDGKAAASPPPGDDDPLGRRVAAAGQLYAEVVASMSGAKP